MLKVNPSIADAADIQLSQFTMDDLEIKTIAVDYYAIENQMPRTTAFIEKFLSEYKVLTKLLLLLEIR
jgi:hypothetical protein